ncbi:MAG: C45 family autoproteolytic acyltransferase/hydrolase [Bdellovibrionales bacterium]
MKRAALGFFLLLLLSWNLWLAIVHVGVLRPPPMPAKASGSANWWSRAEMGMNHIVVTGSPFPRGKELSRLTQDLLARQEDELMRVIDQMLPVRWIQQTLVAGLITWYWDADHYIGEEDLLEMYGVSRHAPTKYNYLIDPYTRQLAFHGLHEVGQLMVDSGVDGPMACTVAAAPVPGGWVLGRNFDFEGGRIFDQEKIVKWIFPERGYAYVSVIWAGMVGAVTGVNDHGLYISMNAAGSDDFRRIGTPSTLVMARVLREAQTTKEAIAILGDSRTFITDIFVILDREGSLVRVEKSPLRQAALEHSSATIVTNHLVTPTFASDSTNSRRMSDLTTVKRFERGEELLGKWPKGIQSKLAALQMLTLLRDKGVDSHGQPLHLGHRAAIDALISTHSVIWDSTEEILYVSQGPSLSGRYIGYDTRATFSRRQPVVAGELPSDPSVTTQDFENLQADLGRWRSVRALLNKKDCSAAKSELDQTHASNQLHITFLHLLGDVQTCLGDSDGARQSWQKALDAEPPYRSERVTLERKLR